MTDLLVYFLIVNVAWICFALAGVLAFAIACASMGESS